MPSKTSFCNGTEFRKCLSRWWPLWVIYGVILFIMLPGVLLNARSTIPYVSAEQISYLSNVILSETQMLLPLTAFSPKLHYPQTHLGSTLRQRPPKILQWDKYLLQKRICIHLQMSQFMNCRLQNTGPILIFSRKPRIG